MARTRVTEWMAVAVAAASAMALVADAQTPAAESPQAGEQAQQPRLMTHGGLAQLLVRKLGLYRFLPANPTDLECMMWLSQNGVFPSPTLTPTEQNPTPGWSLDPDKEVTLAEFAVALVRSLRLEGNVQGDPADPQNWLNVLKEAQVPTDTIGAGVAAVTPLSDVTPGASPFQLTRDPLYRRYVVESVAAGVVDTLVFPERPRVVPPTPPPPAGPRPRPVTPTRP